MQKGKTPTKEKSKSSKSAKPVNVAVKMTTADKLSVIQPRLRRGDLSTLSSRTGYDHSHVSRVLKGKGSNPSGEIVKAAYQMVSKRKVKV
jgi:hypothetical protein